MSLLLYDLSVCLHMYRRNVEARRQYQVNYNQVKRVTRRKLAKSDLHKLQERKRQELCGAIPYVSLRLKIFT